VGSQAALSFDAIRTVIVHSQQRISVLLDVPQLLQIHPIPSWTIPHVSFAPWLKSEIEKLFDIVGPFGQLRDIPFCFLMAHHTAAGLA
jgi:hypothetical protein